MITAFPIDLRACHGGQAARAELDAYLATEAADRRRGHRVLQTKSLRDLAEMDEDLRTAILVSADVFPELERADLGALQDVAKLLRDAGRG